MANKQVYAVIERLTVSGLPNWKAELVQIEVAHPEVLNGLKPSSGRQPPSTAAAQKVSDATALPARSMTPT